MTQHNTAVRAVFPSGYDAARHRAAFFERPGRGRIVVSGRDRASYLHGLLTNDVASLRAGEGCYAAYLTPQGRMIADLYLYELGDILLLAVPLHVRDTLLAKFEQFVFSEDVQISGATDAFAEIAVVGPDAPRIVASLGGAPDEARLRSMPEHGNMRAEIGGHPVIVASVTDTGEPGLDLFVERAAAAAIVDALASDRGAVAIDAATAETLRIESGVPLFGRYMDEETIPLEAGIESRAISLTKGCYVGQEVIIRVLHRGHGRVVRKLVGLVIDGAAAVQPRASVRSGDREIGVVTSSTVSPALGRPIALGSVHRDFTAAGTAVSVDGVAATVADLPFVPSNR